MLDPSSHQFPKLADITADESSSDSATSVSSGHQSHALANFVAPLTAWLRALLLEFRCSAEWNELAATVELSTQQMASDNSLDIHELTTTEAVDRLLSNLKTQPLPITSSDTSAASTTLVTLSQQPYHSEAHELTQTRPLVHLVARLAEFTSPTREILAMRLIEGLKYKKIAEQLNLPKSSVVQYERSGIPVLLSKLSSTDLAAMQNGQLTKTLPLE